jgi:hypothetical protein
VVARVKAIALSSIALLALGLWASVEWGVVWERLRGWRK